MLLKELKTVATEFKRSQIEDEVGGLWAALAAEEDTQRRETGALLVVGVGAEGREGREESGGLNNENNGRICW